MSTDRTEFGIPVIFDVIAHDRQDAGEALVEMLKQARVVGREFDTDGRGAAECVSWWTLERVDKDADRNDNDAGVVVFDSDLDYLRSLLQDTRDSASDAERHERLLTYFDPNHRTGWTAPTDEEAIDEPYQGPQMFSRPDHVLGSAWR